MKNNYYGQGAISEYLSLKSRLLLTPSENLITNCFNGETEIINLRSVEFDDFAKIFNLTAAELKKHLFAAKFLKKFFIPNGNQKFFAVNKQSIKEIKEYINHAK